MANHIPPFQIPVPQQAQNPYPQVPAGYGPPPGAPPQAPQAAPPPWMPQGPGPQAPAYGPPAGYPQAPPPNPYAPPQAPAYGPPPGAPVGGGNAHAALAGFNGAQVSPSGNYLNAAVQGQTNRDGSPPSRGYGEGPGTHDVEITDIHFHNSQQDGWGAVIEFKILRSTTQIPVDTKRGEWIAFSDKKMSPKRTVKIIAALSGLDLRNPEHMKIINEQVSPQQQQILIEAADRKVFNGKRATISTSTTVTKQKGQLITVGEWSPAR